MRISARIAAAAAAITLGVLTLLPGQAMATVPRPSCESGSLEVLCEASSPATTTWTIVFPSTTYTFVTAEPILRFGCDSPVLVKVSYSYVSDGVTQSSPVANVTCRSGPWQ